MDEEPRSAGPAGPSALSAVDRERAEGAVRTLIAALGEDPDRHALRRTPSRVVDALARFFFVEDVDVAQHAIPLGDESETLRAVVVRGVPFRALCEHHLVPFAGSADVTVFPDRTTIGLSRLVDTIDLIAHRLQLQEQLGDRITRSLAAALSPHGVHVRLQAQHSCMLHGQSQLTGRDVVTVSTWGVVPFDFRMDSHLESAS